MPGNITLAVSQANITVDQQNTTVAVTSTPSTVVVGESRTTSNADIRNAISNAFPITYNTTSGVIGIDPSAISGGNVVFGGNATGNITVDKSTGAFFQYNVTGNVTGITLSNFNAGETATIIFTQDAIGGHQIDTTTTPSNWSAWNFASGSSSIDENATNWSTLSIFGVGPTGGTANAYYASVVREETADVLSNLIVTGNVSAGNVIGTYLHGDGSNISGVSTLTNAQALAFIEAGTYGNLDLSTNVSVDHFLTVGTPSKNGIVQADQFESRTGSGTATYLGRFNGDGGNITGITTTQVAEGTNLYYTDSRFDTRLATKDTDNLSEGTNLYYTDARSRGAVSVTQASASGAGTLAYNNSSGVFTYTPPDLTAFGLTNAEAQAYIQSNGLTMTSAISSNSNVTTTANTSAVHGTFTGAQSITATGNVSIGGRLTVTGNIDSETVKDLLIEDRDITLGYGTTGAPSSNSQIIIDRGSSANTYLKWDEGTDKWKFSNNGSTEFVLPESTTDLAEGTNLYYTQSRFDTAFGNKTTSDLSEGTNLYYTDARVTAYTGGLPNLTGNITTSGDITATGFGSVEGYNGTFGNVVLNANAITIANNGSITFSDNNGAINGVNTFNASNRINCLTGNIVASTNSGIGGFLNGIGLVQFNDTGNLAAGYSLAIGDTNPQGIFSIQQDSSNPTKYDHWKRFGGDGSGLDTKGINNHYYRANGTVASPGVIRSGGMVVEDNYHAYDGTQFYKGARSYVIHDSPAGAPATNAVNLSYEFTSIPSVNNEHSRLAICANGSIQFNANNTIQNSADSANRNGGNASIALDGTISSVANITATGNVSGNYILGNGSLLTGISAGGGVSNAQAQSFIQSSGLAMTANVTSNKIITTTSDITGANVTATAKVKSAILDAGDYTMNTDIYGNSVTGNYDTIIVKSGNHEPNLNDGTPVIIADTDTNNPFANGSIKADNTFYVRQSSSSSGYYFLYQQPDMGTISTSGGSYNNTTGTCTFTFPTLNVTANVTMGPDSAFRQGNAYSYNHTIGESLFIGEAFNRNAQLDVSGDTTITNYSGNAALTMVNNRNDSAIPTQLVMKQNKNAGFAAGVAGDQLSVLKTQGMTSNTSVGLKTYANVLAKITDPTEGSEDGEIDFRLLKAGTETSTLNLKSTEATLQVPLNVGTDTSAGNLSINSADGSIEFTTESDVDHNFNAYRDGSNGINLHMFKAGGNVSTPTAIGANDFVTRIRAFAHDGTQFYNSSGAEYTIYQDANTGSVGTDDVPLAHEFSVQQTPDTGFAKSVLKMTADRRIIFNDTGVKGFGSYTGTANISADGKLHTAGNITSDGNISGNFILGNGSLLTGITGGGSTDSFGTFTVSGQTNVQASQANAQVEFAAGSGITLTTSGNTITIAGSGGSYGNTEVANFLNSDTMTANIAYTGNLLVGAPTATSTLTLTGGDVIAGNTNIGAGNTADQLIVTANSGAADPGFSDGTAIVGKNGTGDAAYWNGNTYYTKSVGTNTYDLYTDSGLTTKSASTLGSLYNTASNGIQFDYPGIGTSQANVIGTLEVTEGVNLATDGSNADFGGNITTGSTKGIFVGTGGINAQGGGTITMSGLRVTDFSANDPLAIKIVANSGLTGGSFASPFQGSIVYVTGDRHGSRGAPAYWSGTEWRYFSDDANVTI